MPGVSKCGSAWRFSRYRKLRFQLHFLQENLFCAFKNLQTSSSEQRIVTMVRFSRGLSYVNRCSLCRKEHLPLLQDFIFHLCVYERRLLYCTQQTGKCSDGLKNM